MRGLVIQPNESGQVGPVEVGLPALQQLVGGYIECVTIPPAGCHLYCNEEGKLMGLPANLEATRLAHRLGWAHGDVLCGPVVFLGSDDAGEEADVPQAVVDTYQALSA